MGGGQKVYLFSLTQAILIQRLRCGAAATPITIHSRNKSRGNDVCLCVLLCRKASGVRIF